jgi:hypothetical protein
LELFLKLSQQDRSCCSVQTTSSSFWSLSNISELCLKSFNKCRACVNRAIFEYTLYVFMYRYIL